MMPQQSLNGRLTFTGQPAGIGSLKHHAKR